MSKQAKFRKGPVFRFCGIQFGYLGLSTARLLKRHANKNFRATEEDIAKWEQLHQTIRDTKVYYKKFHDYIPTAFKVFAKSKGIDMPQYVKEFLEFHVDHTDLY